MVGIMSAVVLARRRSIHSHQYDYDRYSRCGGEPFLPWRPIRSSSTPITTTTMDATALKARTRLEEKLASFRSRWNKHPQPPPPPPAVQVRSSFNVLQSKQIQRSETEKRTRKTESEICVVCLEELQGLGGEVTKLPCSHRYHSDCLLPWLATHSHCPCCRLVVPSL